MQRLARGRLLQQHGGFSGRAGDPAAATPGIYRIADHRVPHVLQVHPNLVGTACVQLQPQKIDYREACHHAGIGAGGTTPRGDRHPFAVAWMATDRGIDPELGGVQVSPGQGRIASVHPPGGDRSTELSVSEIGLRHDHQSRGVAIQPVHDSGPSLGTTG
jgi:hypothetical protein